MIRYVGLAVGIDSLPVRLGEMTSARYPVSIRKRVWRNVGKVVDESRWRMCSIVRRQVQESIMSIGETENGSRVGP